LTVRKFQSMHMMKNLYYLDVETQAIRPVNALVVLSTTSNPGTNSSTPHFARMVLKRRWFLRRRGEVGGQSAPSPAGQQQEEEGREGKE